ncbi:hypothetical protein L1987_24914 [Smallanthus sonchifolius]|uniref:Uncharacterized protein n=1 Tax=Smallanthus sonchifolius TaxID=185202 RepID=A0ACB9IN81_9ASTR|nr:hypothetical protein L1987_24914 [Smallanthus sonchifolius]
MAFKQCIKLNLYHQRSLLTKIMQLLTIIDIINLAIHHTKLVVDSSVTLLKYAYPLLKQRVLHWILESNTVGAILYQSLKLLFPVLAAKR